MPREVVPAEKANLDAVTIPAAKLLWSRPNVLQMIAVAGVFGQKPVWMVMSGNVIQHSDGPVARAVSSNANILSNGQDKNAIYLRGF